MSGGKCCVLTTVGMSIVGNVKKPPPKLSPEETLGLNFDALAARVKDLPDSDLPGNEQADLKSFLDALIGAKLLPDPDGDDVRFKDFKMANAELQSLLLWLENTAAERAEERPALRIALFPSTDAACRLNAVITRAYFQRLKRKGDLFLNRWNLSSIDDASIDSLPISVDDNAAFARTIDTLFATFDEKRDKKHGEEKDTSFVINCTGSFKAIVTYATLYGQIHQLPCIYTFENKTKDCLHLTPLPLSFALGELDDEMAVLQGIQEGGGALGLKDVPLRALPQWLGGLITQDERGEPTTLGLAKVLVDHYRTNRRKASGVGRGLLDEIRRRDGGEPLAAYIERRIANEWAELWLGDQIPETVEHSRRHSKRLMEIAANILRSAPPGSIEATGLDDAKALALFVSAIYLHDIGHTALAFPVTPSGGGAFPLGLFPSSVREVHHLLSRDLIEAEGTDLLPDDDNDLAPMLRELVPLICAYHRGYTHLLKEQGPAQPKEIVSSVGKFLYGDEHFNETLRPLEEALEAKKEEIAAWGLSIPKVLACAALLRVVDGCDVQADRTVDDVYLKARKRRTQKEGETLWHQLRPRLQALPEALCNELLSLRDLLQANDVAKQGTIADELAEEIDQRTKSIYSSVFFRLRVLKETCGWTFLQSRHEEVWALSLANRVAFKWEQFLHFRKHQAVGFVLPMPSVDGQDVTIGIWPNTSLQEGEETDRKKLDAVAEEIEEEIKGKPRGEGHPPRGGVGNLLNPLNLTPKAMPPEGPNG